MTAERIPRRIRVIQLSYSVAHYRAGMMRRLSQNPELDFTVCGGQDPTAWDGSKVASIQDVGKLEDINFRPLRSRRLKWFPLRNYEWQPQAVRMAWREDFDVLICFGHKSLSNWLVHVICRLRGIPLIEWTQGLKGPERGLKWALKKLMLRWAKTFLLYGRFAADFFVAHGFRPDRVFVIHNSLDHDRQVAIRNSLTPDMLAETRARFRAGGPDDRLAFFSGRLIAGKNIGMLVEAVAAMKGRGRRVVAVLIGSGAEEPALRRQAEKLGVQDRVVFHGACYDEEVLGRIISAADLCVVPRTAGLIVMHSLVYGTPLLTCDNSAWTHPPEIEAIVEGRTGGFFRDGDVKDLADKMESMLYPTSCKQAMAQNCMREIDTEWTPEYMESAVIRAINSVLPPERHIPVRA